MLSRPLAVLSAPLDCSGRGRGEEAGSAALVGGGFGRLSTIDVSWLDIRVRDVVRSELTGVLAHRPICEASEQIAAGVEEILLAGRTPVVLGGDCTILVGAMSGARRVGHVPGLLFLDGHADASPPEVSPSGETADMDFGIVTGTVDVRLTDDDLPLVAPEAAVVVGYRLGEELDGGGHEIDLVDERVGRWSADDVRATGCDRLGLQLARRFGEHPPMWLHLDVDVFDPGSLPAVTYPEPGGLSFDEVAALLAPVMSSVPLLGVTVADFVADADPTGEHARHLAEWFSDVVR